MRKASNPDIVFLIPGDKKDIYGYLENELTAHEPPLWALMLASYLKTKGFVSEIWDLNVDKMSDWHVLTHLKICKPKLVCIIVYGHNPSASTQHMDAACNLSRNLQPNDIGIQTIMVGGHIAALPRQSLIESQASYVCTGEGFYTLIDILEGVPFPRGIGYISCCKYEETDPAPLLGVDSEYLDEFIPSIQWDLIDLKAYRAFYWHDLGGFNRSPYASIYTSLSCPYNCNFCCIKAPFKRGEELSGIKNSSYRVWSPLWVYHTIYDLYQRGVRSIKIADELFTGNIDRAIEICRMFAQTTWASELNMWMYSRINTTPIELIELLLPAGIRWVALGIESGDSEVLRIVNKNISETKVRSVIQNCRKYGVWIGANYIFGLDGDSYESMHKTLSLAIDINAEWSNFNVAMPYPGSKMYDNLNPIHKLKDRWRHYAQYSPMTVHAGTTHLTGEQVISFRDMAWREYYSNPKYHDLMRRTFGQAGINKVRHMLEQPRLR